MLKDGVALVTGGSAGIGLSVARKLVEKGARVALVARTRTKLDEVAAQLGGAPKAVAFPLDVGDLGALEKLPALVAERMGRLDWVVNNAGVHHRGPVMDLSPGQIAEMVHVNLAAPAVLLRAAVPLLPEGGAVVNVASLAGFVPVLNAATYSASKAGLRAFSRAAGEELRARGILVATVSPGPVDTDFFGDVERVTDLTFSQPMSTPDEVADAVLACLERPRAEIAMPWLSGKLATLGYLSPAFLRAVRPLMERIGRRNKRAYAARKAARSPST